MASPNGPGGSATSQPDLAQRLVQRRIERLEKVRDQLQHRHAGPVPAANSTRSGPPTAQAQPRWPVPAEAVPPVVVEPLPARELPLQPPVLEGPGTNAAPSANLASTPAAAKDPSHEVVIDIPDESEMPKPRATLNNRLRGNRPGP